jgi:hypothetical protein
MQMVKASPRGDADQVGKALALEMKEFFIGVEGDHADLILSVRRIEKHEVFSR